MKTQKTGKSRIWGMKMSKMYGWGIKMVEMLKMTSPSHLQDFESWHRFLTTYGAQKSNGLPLECRYQNCYNLGSKICFETTRKTVSSWWQINLISSFLISSLTSYIPKYIPFILPFVVTTRKVGNLEIIILVLYFPASSWGVAVYVHVFYVCYGMVWQCYAMQYNAMRCN